jgi:carboxyl-terminal processing protease
MSKEARQRSNSLRRRMQGFLVFLLLFCAVPCQSLYSATAPADREYFDIVKSIDLFGEVYREVSKSYVDSLNVSKMIYAGIDGMLHTLDPYTVFLNEEDSGDLDDLTNGQYAGIGVIISPVDGVLYVTSVVDGSAAAKAGIRAGDAIVSIDSKDVRRSPFKEVKSLMKGVSGSALSLKLEREGSPPLSVRVIREEVRVSPVSYSAIIDGIGYVEMKTFSSHSAENLREAIQALERQAAEKHVPMKGMILDLRNNPGGLLTVAVDVASLYVNNGSLVVSIRGRAPETSKTYVTNVPPLNASLPLAVLINSESASASEIVAGAIQDLDRGVVIGERSFGKGLVQSVIKISYNNTLKLTTAKYYTPSGRLIQKEKEAVNDSHQVLHKVKEDVAEKVFYTRGKRKVYGSGGITPDIQLADPARSSYIAALRKKGMLLLFPAVYCSAHPVMPSLPLDRHALMASFSDFLHRKNFTYISEPERRFNELKESMKKTSGAKDAEWVKTHAGLHQEVNRLKELEIAKESERVAQLLEEEIIRHFNERLARKTELDHDPVVKKALEVLSDSRKYSGILHP